MCPKRTHRWITQENKAMGKQRGKTTKARENRGKNQMWVHRGKPLIQTTEIKHYFRQGLIYLLLIICIFLKNAYILTHNLMREKQVILLMIPTGEGWHYLAVKKLSTLLRGIALIRGRIILILLLELSSYV